MSRQTKEDVQRMTQEAWEQLGVDADGAPFQAARREMEFLKEILEPLSWPENVKQLFYDGMVAAHVRGQSYEIERRQKMT